MTTVQLVLKQPSPVAVWPPRIVSKLFHEPCLVNTWSRQVTRSQSIVPCETKFWKSHIEKAIWSSSWTIIYENIRQDIRRQFKRHERVERPAASGKADDPHEGTNKTNVQNFRIKLSANLIFHHSSQKSSHVLYLRRQSALTICTRALSHHFLASTLGVLEVAEHGFLAANSLKCAILYSSMFPLLSWFVADIQAFELVWGPRMT